MPVDEALSTTHVHPLSKTPKPLPSAPATQTLDHVVHHSTSPSPKPPQNKVMRSACRPSIKPPASSPGRPLLDVDQCRWGFFLCFFQGGDTSSGSLGCHACLWIGTQPTKRPCRPSYKLRPGGSASLGPVGSEGRGPRSAA